MKIAIVVDSFDSALGIAATSRAQSNASIEVIEGLKFLTPGSLVKYLSKNDFDLILFSWRFLAYELFSFALLASRIKKVSSKSLFAVLIPDHLGSRKYLLEKERSLLNAVDYFLVTNDQLLFYYSGEYPQKCKGILHDMPDLRAIEVVLNSKTSESSGAVWVGNSAWGVNKGIIDHKRLHELVYPLIQNGLRIEIIDSAFERKENIEVLRIIRTKKYLFQTSREEGTGLPILEACALGVIPITTNVGIAKELLSGELSALVAKPSVGDFMNAINWADKNSEFLHQELKKRFANYIKLALSEELYFHSKKGSHRIKVGWVVQNKQYVVWFARSVRHRYLATDR